MIKELLYKWFGLEPFPCNSCEILRSQLEESNRERRELLQRLLVQPEPPTQEAPQELKPIMPQFVPWRIRQQMLEAEDRKKAQILKEMRKQDTSELEKELGVDDASQVR